MDKWNYFTLTCFNDSSKPKHKADFIAAQNVPVGYTHLLLWCARYAQLNKHEVIINDFYKLIIILINSVKEISDLVIVNSY